MKILHLIHKLQNRGAETFACQLANHQKKMGNEVKITAIYSGKANLPCEDPIEILEGREYKYLNWMPWKKLAEYVINFQPDILQANSGDTLKYAVISKKIYGWETPIVFRNASEVGQYLNSKFQKKFNNFLYRNVNAVVSVSKRSKEDIIQHFAFLKNKTSIIPIGLEGKTILTPAIFTQAHYNIVHVGGFSFEKNHEGLLRIFKKIMDQGVDAHLHLIGDGPLKTKTEGLSRELSLENNISFYGFVSNPLDYIQAADVLILPSIIEGLPGVLLEAMMCKTPVVAYNVGGISEIVTSQTGNLVERNDEAGFANAVVKTLENPNFEQIKTAHQMVLKEFMNEEIAGRFVEVYEAIILES